ncbi:Sensor protein QseC [Saezia sanguinis]|uniref:Sensor protein QseC n=1 Tax=Saezia sanguinis TaxID=1965230 RepID=A0A433SAI6_9BURK|nr:quorum sensing histidine kinase QseC [Saezia sanguinis]RUS65732.1 Sensor protein QseC [Saezia sanguinis]
MAKRTWSLRLRLSLFFAVLLFVAWSVAAVFSWWQSKRHIDTFFDTQQMLFAKQLASAEYVSVAGHLPDTDDMLSDHGDEGDQEDDALAFAVFRADGTLLLNDGEEGKHFPFMPHASGFINMHVDGDPWRIVWLTSLDGQVVVAVGQELEYRDDMAFAMLAGQMLPWALLLPVLLFGLVWMLTRELAPLRGVAGNLEKRPPEDTSPIEMDVQSEVRPLVNALNNLFVRIDAMLRRERVFISDAAHELRTPLAGLSVQAQVARNAKQPETRDHALAQMQKGIGRASRLVEQLLTLFRLESLDAGKKQADSQQHLGQALLRWDQLVQTAVADFEAQAEAKGITLSVCDESQERTVLGQPELLEILLRNIIGNAVKYTPEAGEIAVCLNTTGLTVSNTSTGMDAATVARLGERFFRPPGQAESGSGLGLSIAQRIAQLHGLNMDISASQGRFTVTVAFPPA